jgi:hypothetical protein
VLRAEVNVEIADLLFTSQGIVELTSVGQDMLPS